MSTIIVAGILGVICALAVRKIYKDKKNGGCCGGCGGNCSCCHSSMEER